MIYPRHSKGFRIPTGEREIESLPGQKACVWMTQGMRKDLGIFGKKGVTDGLSIYNVCL